MTSPAERDRILKERLGPLAPDFFEFRTIMTRYLMLQGECLIALHDGNASAFARLRLQANDALAQLIEQDALLTSDMTLDASGAFGIALPKAAKVQGMP